MILESLWFAYIFVSAVMALTLFYRWLSWFCSPLRNLPGPKERMYPFSNFMSLRSEPYMEPFKRWWKEAGVNESMIHYNMICWRQAVLVLDKDIVKTILTAPANKENPRFEKLILFLRDIVGDGLLTASGTHWAKHRRILQPAFKTRFLRATLTGAIPWRIDRFLKCWMTAAHKGFEIDVASHMSALTLDIIGDVAFSHNFNALNALESWANQDHTDKEHSEPLELSEVGDELLNYFTKSMKINLLTIVCLLLGLEKLNWYINREVRRTQKFLDIEVEKIVAKARKETLKASSVLHLMLQATSGPEDPSDGEMEAQLGKSASSTNPRRRHDDILNAKDIRDEVKTFMIAGHETTSTWLHWALYALVMFPEVQERVHADILRVAPPSASSGEDDRITLDQIEQMDYMGAFLQEVLRMYPPVGFYVRINTQTETFKGVTIPAGTRLILPPHILHRHPKYWDDPETFLPERWLNVTKEESERRQFAFLAYSAGGRSCKLLFV